MSTKRERHVEIGSWIAIFLETKFQELDMMDCSSMIKSKRDLLLMRAEAMDMARSFKIGCYGLRKEKQRFVDGPPYDAATRTGMYDHDDSG